MNERSKVERLQDYLDGRMTPEERADFEEVLRENRDLAAGARSARRIGAALREEPAELSPGFYARARHRFEESTGEQHSGFRLLSWETAGLAAAAVLAFALFVPHFMREGTPVAVPESALADGRGAAGEKDSDAVPLDEAVAGRRDALEKEAPEPQREKKGKAPSIPAEVQDDAVASDIAVSEGEFAPVPPAVQSGVVDAAPAAEPEARMRQPAAKSPATTQGRSMAKRASAPLGSVAKLEDAEAAAAVALPIDIVEPGTIQTLERNESWDALLRSEAGGELAVLGSPDPSRRLVLIGDRDDLGGCADLDVVSTPDGWEIRYRPVEHAGRERATSGGCAVTVPRDGRPVFLVASP